jgi:hypothetical protein
MKNTSSFPLNLALIKNSMSLTKLAKPARTGMRSQAQTQDTFTHTHASLCPYLVKQPYLATNEHSLGNTTSDARMMLASRQPISTETHPNSPELTQTYRNSLKLINTRQNSPKPANTHRNSPNSLLFVYTN